MPTLSSSGHEPESQPESTPENELHRRRDIAESFGTHAERYDRARPRYPEALIRRIVTAAPGPDVLEAQGRRNLAVQDLPAIDTGRDWWSHAAVRSPRSPGWRSSSSTGTSRR